MKFTFLLLALALLLPLAGLAADTSADTKPADIEHMKVIGAALNAYKKAKGEYPDYLNQLVPEFLEAKTLVSPLGIDADPVAAKHAYDPKLPCSYSYEFGARLVPGNELTFRVLKTIQMQEYGPTVPILRCTLYDDILNLSHAGDVFSSPGIWESDSEELRQLLKKNGLGPGLKEGRKLVVTLTGEKGRPVPGLVLRASRRSAYHLLLPTRDYTTDASGQAIIPVGGGEQAFVALASASPVWYLPPHYWDSREDATPAGQELVPLHFKAYDAGPIGGVVRDAKGMALREAVVNVCLQNEPRRIIGTARTDAQGAWSIPCVPQNFRLELSFQHPGSRWLQARPGTAGLPEAASFFARDADVRLEEPFLVEGVVRLGKKPLAGARILFDPSADTAGPIVTGPDGHFSLPSDDAGPITLVVTADGLAPKSMEVNVAANVAASAPPLEIQLDRGRSLTGRIFRGKNVPVANAPVLLKGFRKAHGGNFDLPAQPVIATTDAEGRFTWPHAPKEVVSCSVIPSDTGEPVNFEWDATKADPLEVNLDP